MEKHEIKYNFNWRNRTEIRFTEEKSRFNLERKNILICMYIFVISYNKKVENCIDQSAVTKAFVLSLLAPKTKQK